MRGGIAERGGIRVGHRIIEINGQSVVATPHEKIIHILTNAVGEVSVHTFRALKIAIDLKKKKEHPNSLARSNNCLIF